VHRAVRPDGVIYLTVEEQDPPRIEQAFATLSARGLPVVRGEVVEGGAGGYHYYPGRDQATAWFRREGLGTVDEGYQQEEGWGYRHFLLRPAPDAPPAGQG